MLLKALLFYNIYKVRSLVIDLLIRAAGLNYSRRFRTVRVQDSCALLKSRLLGLRFHLNFMGELSARLK